MPPLLIAFDLDGTTIDSRTAFVQAAEEYSARLGLPPPNTAALVKGYAAPDEHDFGWGVS